MTTIVLVLIVLNIIDGGFSVTGRRLRMSTHPFLVRMRYFGFGMVAALYLAGHSFLSDDWVSWLAVICLAFGVARIPEKRRPTSIAAPGLRSSDSSSSVAPP